VSIGTQQRISRHVLEDPPSGEVIDAGVGSCVRVRFRRCVGGSRWRVTDRPAHLVPIEESGHDFVFLVFDPVASGSADSSGALRLVRQRTGRPDSAEVRHLTLVVTD
jgi:hypothetical protein